MSTGTLYLIPTPLGKTAFNNSLPEHTLNIIRQLDVFAVENIQSAVKFLKWVVRQYLNTRLIFINSIRKHLSMKFFFT